MDRVSWSRGELDGAFSRYLQNLAKDGEPDSETFADMWRALRAVVVAELRQRTLWWSPPSYLGIDGWESWQAKDLGPGRTESALEELLTDCYVFVFHEHLRTLLAQLQVKGNIDGLVRLHLRNYLHRRQKHHDLLGFWVFESLRQAARQAVDASELWIIEGNEKILNDTVLATRPEGSHANAASEAALRPIVESWTHELLPDLITAGGAWRQWVVHRLRRRLLDLEAEGVQVVRFRDLIDPLKREIRSRFAAAFELGEGESALENDADGFVRIVRIVQPDRRFEERDSFEQLVACVAGLLEGLGETERSRHYLRTLWGFLRVYAIDQGPETLPSGRQLGHLLRIPRKRLPRHWEILRELVSRCQATLGRRPTSERAVSSELTGRMP